MIDGSKDELICGYLLFQAKKSKENLKEITHKVYFDVEIAGKPAGTFSLAEMMVNRV